MAGGGAEEVDSKAFWKEFMRRPEAKQAYQAERELALKKQAWLEARAEVEARGVQRRLVADALEEKDVPADIKKLIAPMFHIRVVAHFLWMVLDECRQSGLSFARKLAEERTVDHLKKLREQFNEGGEERMQGVENQFHAICHNMAEEEQKKQELKPVSADVHTLKDLLEFGQECKREGNLRFKEGLYEEALLIYAQGHDVLKRWKVEKHLKNENKWFSDLHLACLKNKAQAALKLEMSSTALEAADAALAIDVEDHKAWYRRVQAQKNLGLFEDAEASLVRLEDIAQWCPGKQEILRDSEAERKRIHVARLKHKAGTREMLEKAFEAGVFSLDRIKEVDAAAARQEEEQRRTEKEREEEKARRPIALPKRLERNVVLTAALAGDLLDDLAEAYSQRWYQERVRKCARDSNFDQILFLRRLKDIAFGVQQPLLEKWGFEGSEHGVREMTAAIRDHAGKDGKQMPVWLKEKQDACLELLYGGSEDGGMAPILIKRS
eukprot:TRINITY_DN13050_c0_g1_i1.p1 TRINITY_DN13050_c0_g1~~TRINITY_DN13050_c0_g1_i1.p1  ORF type:complete len:495 (+),score=167.92 TRINITY_DN13050_c0_g1_i1:104-1588(+)